LTGVVVPLCEEELDGEDPEGVDVDDVVVVVVVRPLEVVVEEVDVVEEELEDEEEEVNCVGSFRPTYGVRSAVRRAAMERATVACSTFRLPDSVNFSCTSIAE
jgi:hypothetical protein